MTEIIHELTIKGKKEDAYNALTSEKGLSSWWTTDVKVREKIGSINEFGFYGHKAIHYMKVKDLKPNNEVEWVCEKSVLEDWIQTTIKFILYDGPNGLQLRFVQSGFKTTDGLYGAFNYNWANYLTSFKNYVENGKGNPHAS